MKIHLIIISLILLAVTLFFPGCTRERTSEKPPIHLNPNMDHQEKYKAQAESKFFADGATMRSPVEGTVARGELREDTEYFTGKDKEGNFIKKAPVALTMDGLKRGQERFNIYCSPCHSKVGDGMGIIVERGMVPPPSFHIDRIRDMSDGEIFDIITNGIRNMPSYRHQIDSDDRWLIILYLRALQRSQNAKLKDVPEQSRETIR
ncbi:MAG: cytochrome c [bacterium]